MLASIYYSNSSYILSWIVAAVDSILAERVSVTGIKNRILIATKQYLKVTLRLPPGYPEVIELMVTAA